MAFYYTNAGAMPALTRATYSPDNPIWEQYRDRISELYSKNNLKDVMRIMKEKHDFAPTVKQYKTHLTRWGVDKKRVRAHEYDAILQTKRKREQVEGKPTQFYIRGELVPPAKISRFENRAHQTGKRTQQHTLSGIGKPLQLAFRTPSPVEKQAWPDDDTKSRQLPMDHEISSEETFGTFPTDSDSGRERKFSRRNMTRKQKRKEELLSSVVLYRGTVDDLVTRAPSDQQFWSLDMTPIPSTPQTRETTPTQPALHRWLSEDSHNAPWISFSRVSQTKLSGTPNIPRKSTAIPLRSMFPPYTKTRTPAWDTFDWWAAFVNFATTPNKASYPGSPIHILEAWIRSIGRKADNYEDECALSTISDLYGYCESGCRWCYHYRSSPGACRIYRMFFRIVLDCISGSISQERCRTLISHLTFRMLPTLPSTPVIIFDYALSLIFADIATIRFSCVYQFLQMFMDPCAQEYRYAFCRLAMVAAHLERTDISSRLLEELLGDWYKQALGYCRKLKCRYCSYENFVAVVTNGQVSASCYQLPITYEYSTDRHDEHAEGVWERDWYRCADGSLNSDELHVRVIALRTIFEIGEWR